ncbi:methylmalonyl-CoA mutase subunit beta [Pareuzebyella sediminis]|uniref:methylmalonyl-CoA mutase subunit beta n=1 Tax=Pareuzebyella sediminis TaxID=2607998 RepID=UPI0011F08786|nr:methylmalonyl-CoA mutase subunit beta [Pareuzebyella sediminis]
MQKKSLFDEFTKVSAKAWKQKIQYDLKGSDYNEKLVWESPEGIKVKPFYHSDDLGDDKNSIIHHPESWYIGQEIFVAHAKESNRRAHLLLQQGVESLIFIIPSEKTNIEQLLAKIDLGGVTIHFNLKFLSLPFVKNLVLFFGEHRTKFFLNIDTIGHYAQNGNWFSNRDLDQKTLREILVFCSEKKIDNVLSINQGLYQSAGANIVQQLAYSLAHVNEYLNEFSGEILKNMVFKVSMGSNYFFEIAKIRALRWLYKTLATEYGSSIDCHIIAFPSSRNKTLYAYNVNQLRSTAECMSAILGGADTICNLAYDAHFHKTNDFSERLARNQLLVLKHESYFDKIENPAEGSYYIENLTEQLAEKALSLFKQIEAKGGFLNQLKHGTLQRKIRENAAKEQGRFDDKTEVLIGTNSYQFTEDKMQNDLDIYPFVKIKNTKTKIEPIVAKRLAEKYEKERLFQEGWKGK